MKSRFSSKGFVLTLDSAIAIIALVAAAALLFSQPGFQRPQTQTMLFADDSLAFLDNSGYLFHEFDSNELSAAVQNTFSKAKTLFPSNIGLKLLAKKYSYNPAQCRAFGLFNECFSLLETAEFGEALPERFFSSKRLFHIPTTGADYYYSLEYRSWLK